MRLDWTASMRKFLHDQDSNALEANLRRVTSKVRNQLSVDFDLEKFHQEFLAVQVKRGLLESIQDRLGTWSDKQWEGYFKTAIRRYLKKIKKRRDSHSVDVDTLPETVEEDELEMRYWAKQLLDTLTSRQQVVLAEYCRGETLEKIATSTKGIRGVRPIKKSQVLNEIHSIAMIFANTGLDRRDMRKLIEEACRLLRGEAV